jgi:hypothetical protein
MTVSKDLMITCNGCYESKTWSIDVLRHQTLDSVIKNAGFVKDHKGFVEGTDHYCPDCNDREKKMFHVYGGRGEEYLGPVEAWGIRDARQVAWDEFDQENMVKREKQEVDA